MSNETYLRQVLNDQNLSQNQLTNLRGLRDKIEGQLRDNLSGNPRFYYAGSYGKKTLIRASYDLDIVVYWSSKSTFTLQDIYKSVGSVLQKKWDFVRSKRVGWELRFKGDFHIDVVPGKSSSADDTYAYLYNSKINNRFQTSIKIHIDTVKDSERRDIIRLMKLWKKRKNVPITSFILEQMVIDGCKERRASFSDLESQLNASFHYINNNILTKRILDPANSNNVISDELSKEEKNRIRRLANQAIVAKKWSEVFS